ncbi:type I toxin-antitoxin system Fst family toxin [Lactococcus paracarnosus]|uniref:Type I toxin-antitoxin system Fst family toxin n=1 Tax=Pseudolactococcus paracarnosus TaxID=2749962 RepID=A0ABT0AKY4_9LACT|nr:type I toxin-antitoxin system Fst family toxin [Lactococcus paracarnosus]MCJ1977205.1 type I toxin-antitoxin system Fst family toxin [Lactococcus paracarnosus]MCJ1983299.1 type I toxin-antitoxin system Fst family toxin [Lactococcus paracarnosus]MCJ1998520.1 type I toxin-antitoxin system Fst family toxin [Lactococcus paracarnosus]
MLLVLFTTIIAPIITGVAIKLISCWIDKKK